jgi:hypothetical protein
LWPGVLLQAVLKNQEDIFQPENVGHFFIADYLLGWGEPST